MLVQDLEVLDLKILLRFGLKVVIRQNLYIFTSLTHAGFIVQSSTKILILSNCKCESLKKQSRVYDNYFLI